MDIKWPDKKKEYPATTIKATIEEMNKWQPVINAAYNEGRAETIAAYESAKKNAPGLVDVTNTITNIKVKNGDSFFYCHEIIGIPLCRQIAEEVFSCFGTPPREPMSEEKVLELLCKHTYVMSGGDTVQGRAEAAEAIVNHFTASAVNVVEWPPKRNTGQVLGTRIETTQDYLWNEAIDACKAAHAKAQTVDVGRLVEELHRKFIDKVRPLNPEIVKIVDDNFWSLL